MNDRANSGNSSNLNKVSNQEGDDKGASGGKKPILGYWKIRGLVANIRY